MGWVVLGCSSVLEVSFGNEASARVVYNALSVDPEVSANHLFDVTLMSLNVQCMQSLSMASRTLPTVHKLSLHLSVHSQACMMICQGIGVEP